jgi:hypothetical protein
MTETDPVFETSFSMKIMSMDNIQNNNHTYYKQHSQKYLYLAWITGHLNLFTNC